LFNKYKNLTNYNKNIIIELTKEQNKNLIIIKTVYCLSTHYKFALLLRGFNNIYENLQN